MHPNELVKQGIAALKQGNKQQAAKLLHQATKLDPSNQAAWLWMSGCVDSNDDKRTCLEKVIAIDPASDAGKRAAKGLVQLAPSQATPSQATPSLATPSQVPPLQPPSQPLSQVTPSQPPSQPLSQAPPSQAPPSQATSVQPFSIPKATVNQKKKLTKKKKVLVGCLVTLGLFVVCGCLGMLFPNQERATVPSELTNTPALTDTPAPTNTPRPEHSEFLAAAMCQKFVKDRLKAPATAEFAPWNETKAVMTDEDKVYLVQSYVDSQNSFGAMIRTKYVCSVEYVGDQNWKLLLLETFDN